MLRLEDLDLDIEDGGERDHAMSGPSRAMPDRIAITPGSPTARLLHWLWSYDRDSFEHDGIVHASPETIADTVMHLRLRAHIGVTVKAASQWTAPNPIYRLLTDAARTHGIDASPIDDGIFDGIHLPATTAQQSWLERTRGMRGDELRFERFRSGDPGWGLVVSVRGPREFYLDQDGLDIHDIPLDVILGGVES